MDRKYIGLCVVLAAIAAVLALGRNTKRGSGPSTVSTKSSVVVSSQMVTHVLTDLDRDTDVKRVRALAQQYRNTSFDSLKASPEFLRQGENGTAITVDIKGSKSKGETHFEFVDKTLDTVTLIDNNGLQHHILFSPSGSGKVDQYMERHEGEFAVLIVEFNNKNTCTIMNFTNNAVFAEKQYNANGMLILSTNYVPPQPFIFKR